MLCTWYRSGLDIVFNAKKFSLFVVGKCCSLTVESLKIGNDNVVWHNELKYLAHLFQSGKVFKPVFDGSMRRFLRATAYMLYRVYAIARPSVCPSVRLSHGWISQKRLKLGSCNFYH